MDLGEILKMAAQRDTAGAEAKQGIVYREYVENGEFRCKLSCKHEGAVIEAAAPYDGLEMTKNGVRLHFLSMLFNATLVSMRIKKYRGQQKNKKRP